MILPTKYIPASDSTLGRAATLLSIRRSNPTVSELWYACRSQNGEVSFDAFTEALTLLFLIGAVDLDRGILKWTV
jgi:hypothetical protein